MLKAKDPKHQMISFDGFLLRTSTWGFTAQFLKKNKNGLVHDRSFYPGGPKNIKLIVFWKFDHYLCRDLQSTIPSGTIFSNGRLDFQGFISGLMNKNL